MQNITHLQGNGWSAVIHGEITIERGQFTGIITMHTTAGSFFLPEQIIEVHPNEGGR